MNPGGIALVCYEEPGPLWHTRVLLAHGGSNDWAILTPDHDVYIEEMSQGNSDFTGFHYCGEAGHIPGHINPAHVYAFHPMTPAELGAFKQQGEVLAQAHLRANGGQAAGAVVAPAVVPVSLLLLQAIWGVCLQLLLLQQLQLLWQRLLEELSPLTPGLP